MEKMKVSKKRKVLIVEDDHLVSEMIRGMLEELGYEIAGTLHGRLPLLP